MLTDDEIDRITDVQWVANNRKPIYAAHRAYARAIEAAIAAAPQPQDNDELVRAARDALACMREYSSKADEDCGEPGCDECHAMRPTWAALDTLRRALDAVEAQEPRNA